MVGIVNLIQKYQTFVLNVGNLFFISLLDANSNTFRYLKIHSFGIVRCMMPVHADLILSIFNLQTL